VRARLLPMGLRYGAVHRREISQRRAGDGEDRGGDPPAAAARQLHRLEAPRAPVRRRKAVGWQRWQGFRLGSRGKQLSLPGRRLRGRGLAEWDPALRLQPKGHGVRGGFEGSFGQTVQRSVDRLHGSGFQQQKQQTWRVEKAPHQIAVLLVRRQVVRPAAIEAQHFQALARVAKPCERLFEPA